ncbi:hypothetical protein SAMN02799630_01202 [Paenibacillus sp. UNCCL117]|uniref:hypothetical protein n=1 Tax=unclassified Paenibacillus TaxID=185978 RepID=UPI000884F6C3|nr:MULTISPECIES: hypothetical protein [unclassified Paenibacillus]SDC69353.1 hypothetical protein SAMN04488602_103180 [Paenibacillus sp. cl123]SFW23897.1 hypothetical protein SAMN02799630_01202 [Paenibacillus sp. UNCCL117]
MKELRDQYKNIVLDACRIAVKGGGMTAAFEDWIIDNIDRIIDDLSDDDFAHLVMNGTIPVREIETDVEFDRFTDWQLMNESAAANSFNEAERAKMEQHRGILDALRTEYKAREWDL